MQQHPAVDRVFRAIDAVLGVAFLSLFVYATLGWLGALPGGPSSQSGALVALTGAMLLQPISWHILKRNRRFGYAILALSVAGLALSLHLLR